MNILTFDIEDWYNCDFISQDYNWDKYEVRLYQGVDLILDELEKRNLKGTFFCLGWIAEKHPNIIRKIFNNGHHIGCHSYQHELATRLNRKSFFLDVEKSKNLIEDIIGKEINSFRAPGFSITENNKWALEVLTELNFQYDCSLFPAAHDYGGFVSYGKAEPAKVFLPNGTIIKEFPINYIKVLNKNIVFSGGGFFRIFPYQLIKFWSKQSPYLMTYFHPRDFDQGQPIIESLPLIRKFKSYVGLKHSFEKFKKFLNDFDFITIEQANNSIDWDQAKKIML